MLPTTFTWIQALRAFAALAVFAFHGVELPLLFFPEWAPLKAFTRFGYAGVDLFFVISGFIVSRAAMLTPAGHPAGSFILRRLIRIFSGYWAAIALFLGYAFFLRPAQPPDLTCWAAAILLCDNVAKNWLFVAWSLTYELMFYTGLALLLAGRLSPARFGYVICAALGLLIVINLHDLLHGIDVHASGILRLPDMLRSGYSLEFLSGAALYACVVHRGLSRRVLMVIACVTAVVGGINLGSSAIAVITPASRAFTWGPLAVCLLSLALLLESFQKRAPQWLHTLGDASYSLYLLHPVLIDASAFLIGNITHGKRQIFALALVSYAIPALSVFWFRHVEEPLHRWSLARLERRPGSPERASEMK